FVRLNPVAISRVLRNSRAKVVAETFSFLPFENIDDMFQVRLHFVPGLDFLRGNGHSSMLDGQLGLLLHPDGYGTRARRTGAEKGAARRLQRTRKRHGTLG